MVRLERCWARDQGYLPHLPYEDAVKAADPKYADVVSYAGTIPHQAFMIYQAMFAIITPALISGAIAERMSFRAYSLVCTAVVNLCLRPP